MSLNNKQRNMKKLHSLWKIEQFIEMMMGVLLVAIGLSFMLKSGLGQSALTAFTQCVSVVIDVKGGTLIMWFYLFCIFLQIVLQKKEFERVQYLQILVSWVQGIVMNLLCYDISFFANIKPTSYTMQWMFILFGIMLVSCGVAITMAANLVKQPFEQLVMVISQHIHVSFRFLRTMCDILFIILALLMIVFFALDDTVLREGTWVSMLLLGNSMAFTFPFVKKHSFYYKRTHDVHEEENIETT